MWSPRICTALALLATCTQAAAPPAADSASASGPWPMQTFETEPSFHPPYLKVEQASTPAPGYLFFAPAALAPQVAPLIMTDASELIWQGQINNSAFSFGMQTYKGAPVLVYWNGTIFPEPAGRGYGTISILDQTYTEIAKVTLPGNFVSSSGAKFPSNVDLHEIYVTNRDTVLITANNVTRTDLTSVGGSPDGWIVDCLVYEIDIATNRVLFRWSALEHRDAIPLSVSVYPLGSEGFDGTSQAKAWGYFHINAVAPLNDGYIMSSRYTCSLIAIDRSGKVLWRISGRDGADFRLDSDATFCFQHHIRPVYADSKTYRVANPFVASLHDNDDAPIDNGTTPTSGLFLEIDTKGRHVRRAARYRNPRNPIFAPAQGSAQRLPNGHVFLGHGYFPLIEEFAADGNIVETVQFGPMKGTISYRAFRHAWIGCPTYRPVLRATKVTQDKHPSLKLAMSWNGATEFDHWVIRALAPHKNGAMQTLRTVQKTGFETKVTIPYFSKVQVQAVALKKHCGCEDMNKHSSSNVVDIH